MNQEKLEHFVKISMIINGIADITLAICLIFLPRFLAQTLQFEDFNDGFRFLAGGYGIAVLCLGITRIWVAIKNTFFWETVILGLIEGSLLGTFCLISIIMTEITFINAFLSMFIGFGFMIIYGGSLIYRNNLAKNKN